MITSVIVQETAPVDAPAGNPVSAPTRSTNGGTMRNGATTLRTPSPAPALATPR